jgi:hypothetical protein
MARPKSVNRAELFEEAALDPMAAATGSRCPAPADKRKAGFYLSADLLARFDRKFYELKLSGARVANKSALLEAVLVFALEDMDRGTNSRLLRELE